MKTELTIYLCLDGSTVIGAGKTLPKLIANTAALAGNSYYYYYRKMRGKDEVSVLINEVMFKIVRFNYAK